MPERHPRPAIPEPVATTHSLYNTVMALKEAVEVLQNQRGPGENAAVIWRDMVALGLIDANAVPQDGGPPRTLGVKTS